MLSGGKQNALAHQAGGVADSSYVTNVSFNFKIIEIDATEDDPRVGRRRNQSQLAWYSRVQAHSRSLNGPMNCKLIRHSPKISFSLVQVANHSLQPINIYNQ